MKIKHLFQPRSVESLLGKQEDPYVKGSGHLWVDHLKLESLEGCPNTVKNSFFCQGNLLKNLKGGPQSVGADYLASQNKLISLEGAPAQVPGDFYCSSNELQTLVGGPKKVGDKFICYNNKLTSLEGCPSSMVALVAHTNNLTSLNDIHKHIKHLSSFADFDGNPITSHVLGLLRIQGGFDEVSLDNKDVEKILNKHLRGDRDILACQEELIEAGFEEFAQL
jgi:hypothetical protein